MFSRFLHYSPRHWKKYRGVYKLLLPAELATVREASRGPSSILPLPRGQRADIKEEEDEGGGEKGEDGIGRQRNNDGQGNQEAAQRGEEGPKATHNRSAGEERAFVECHQPWVDEEAVNSKYGMSS